MRHFILVLFAAVLLAGCAAQPTKDDDQTQAGSEQSTDGAQTSGFNDGTGANATSFTPGDEPYRKEAINDANSPLSQKLIYFDFNADSIKNEYRDLITWHGRYLASNPDMKVRLDGHTDERGSREYNVALGERRAQSVRQLLKFQGATDKQIEVVSFGEEKPVAFEHAESAWSQNRRVQLVYEAN